MDSPFRFIPLQFIKIVVQLSLNVPCASTICATYVRQNVGLAVDWMGVAATNQTLSMQVQHDFLAVLSLILRHASVVGTLFVDGLTFSTTSSFN